MFSKNKYTKWYYKIIENRQSNPIEGVIVEKHHIVPKSLGGSNKKKNIVSLTPKEHFICHLLLVKMTEGKDKMKMSYAIRCMANRENPHQDRYKVSSALYEMIKRETRESIGDYFKGENNPFYGRKHSNDSRRKMSEKRALQVHPLLGTKRSDETKQLLREANARQFEDPKQRELRRKKSKELWADPEWRAKYKGNTGKSWFHNQDKTECKLFNSGEEPSDWIKGRIIKKKGG